MVKANAARGICKEHGWSESILRLQRRSAQVQYNNEHLGGRRKEKTKDFGMTLTSNTFSVEEAKILEKKETAFTSLLKSAAVWKTNDYII